MTALRAFAGVDLGFQKGGGANMDTYICSKIVDTTSVRSTLSMRNMLYLEGSGGMLPQEILQIWPIEIEFGSNFE